MMNKVLATMIKEWQLMRRDVSGLLLLLVMPAALIVVMALIQDAPFKDYEELKFDLLMADNDHGSLARQITSGLKSGKNFHVVDSIDGKPLEEDQLKKLLNSGAYKVGIVIPQGVTAEIVNSANIVVNDISRKTGMEAHLPTRDMRSEVYVRLYFDPVAKPAFRTAISSALDKYITYSSSNILMQRLALLNGGDNPTNDTTDQDRLRKVMQGISVKEEPLNDKGRYTLHLNTVQHNVPAWAIFGMFFIIIPIAGHMIREREDGSALRIGLIPGAARPVAFGKIIFFTLICVIQFYIMLGIGLWGMPLVQLPKLYPGDHAWLLLPVAAAIGFAATSYGVLVGSLFRTVNQVLPFGSVSVVILSAIGGIWVPIEVLPHGMQVLAKGSPLHWSLDAVNRVILRNGNAGDVLPSTAVLLACGAVCWVLANVANASRHNNTI